MSDLEYTTSVGGLSYRFGRVGDNAYVETSEGHRYVFVRWQELDLAKFFNERRPANDHSRYTYDATCPKCDDAPAAQPDRVEAAPNGPEMFPKRDGDFVILGPECFTDDSLEVINFKGQNYVAQPDRPEPVDPASVRVGDIVDYETTVEYRLCRIIGEVEQTAEHVTGEDGTSLKIHDKWWNCNIATVRILHRPEPDEAAVEAMARALHAADRAIVHTLAPIWDEMVPSARDEYRDMARTLIRDHGVHVEVPDA